MSRTGSNRKNRGRLRAVAPEALDVSPEATDASPEATDAAPEAADAAPEAADAARKEAEQAESEQVAAVEQEEPAGARRSRRLPREQLKVALESLVFVSDKPAAPAHLAKIVRTPAAEVRHCLEELVSDYAERGIELARIGGGYLFRSAPNSAPYVQAFLAQRPVRLTRAQLETLAIVSYRQPVTRPEVEEIRGVDTGSALHVLLNRGIVKILGRKDEPGRPLLYGTTPYFLEFFGLRSLKELPTLREFSELSEESRDLYARKVGSSPEYEEGAVAQSDDEEGTVARIDDEEGAVAQHEEEKGAEWK